MNDGTTVPREQNARCRSAGHDAATLRIGIRRTPPELIYSLARGAACAASRPYDQQRDETIGSSMMALSDASILERLKNPPRSDLDRYRL